MPLIKKIFFDLETNGFKYIRKHGRRHNIIQIGSVDEHGNIFNEMIKPKHMIHELSTECHGFTRDHVENAKDFVQVWIEFLHTHVFLNKDGENDYDQIVILIAHNCFGFDMFIILEECKRNDIEFHKNIYFFDTLEWYKNNIHLEYTQECPRPYSLGSLYYREFGKDFENAHDAFADVMALKELFYKKNIEIQLSDTVSNGLTGLNKHFRNTLKTANKLKGIGEWRNKVLCKLLNEKAEYLYKYDSDCPIDDIYEYLFKNISIEQAALMLRKELKMDRDDYIAEIISVICNIPVCEVFQKINYLNTDLENLNLPLEHLERLNNEKISSVNELLEYEHFPNEHSDEIKYIFKELNKNSRYVKIKGKF